MEENHQNIDLYLRGAIINNISIFDKLIAYSNKVEISPEFIEQWCIPFIYNLNNNEQDWIAQMRNCKHQINDEIILTNLGDFNWRTRSCGAYFAAIKNATHLTDIIGTHLLQSKVCYAGVQYAKTLASFNTSKAISYLNQYLEHYLLELDFVFDQVEVMTTLQYLDEINHTNYTAIHQKSWINYREYNYQKTLMTYEKMKVDRIYSQEFIQAYDGHVAFWNKPIDTKIIANSINTYKLIRNN